MLPLVSIVIPNYNNANYIVDTIDSALAQDYPNTEIILIDDGSTDVSLEILQKYENRIRVIVTKHRGASAARNSGILAARGDLIALMDSDDLWLPHKLTLQVNHMLEVGLDLIYCGGRRFGDIDINKTIYYPKYEGNCRKAFEDNPTSAVIVLGCSSAVFRKSLLTLSGLFDTTFQNAAEDWDFFRRYCINAKVGFVKDELVLYRKHSNNLSSSSLHDYYNGNCNAVRKMLLFGSDLSVLGSRKIWIKLQFSYMKTFFKAGKLLAGLKCALRVLLPLSV